ARGDRDRSQLGLPLLLAARRRNDHAGVHRVGISSEGALVLAWLLHATRLTWPQLQVVYDVYGRGRLPEEELIHFEVIAVQGGNDWGTAPGRSGTWTCTAKWCSRQSPMSRGPGRQSRSSAGC